MIIRLQENNDGGGGTETKHHEHLENSKTDTLSQFLGEHYNITTLLSIILLHLYGKATLGKSNIWSALIENSLFSAVCIYHAERDRRGLNDACHRLLIARESSRKYR